MHAKQEEEGSWLILLAYVGWWLVLAAWTYGLLSPDRAGLGGDTVVPSRWNYLAAKSLHVVSYTFLATFAGILGIRRRHRLALWLTLAIHAAVTEYLQTFIKGRTGSVRDVGINLMGIMLGVALVLVWRLRNAGRRADQPLSATTIPT